ncbi:MAG: septum formation initiator family protein [Verrucomicrobiales bacterium]|nr:septum formation initiator family protein [Verrucomicrobiales bacterium]
MPRLLALLAAVVILLLGIMTCIPLIREKAVQKRAQLQLMEELETERARTLEIQKRIAAVRNDPSVVERLAREKFGLARTGEVVFKFRGDLPATHVPQNLVSNRAPAVPGPASTR